MLPDLLIIGARLGTEQRCPTSTSENGQREPLRCGTLSPVVDVRQMPPEDACFTAVQARDPRFDGRFVTAVLTTGIYCRPICPARTPKRVNVRFLPSAAAAEAEGFRACRRCRPDRAVWAAARLGDDLIARALRHLDAANGDELSAERLAAHCGVSVRQLDRRFRESLGTTPARVARSRRLHFAKRLLETTDRSVTEIAFASGFGSLRRFHAAFRETFDASPSELRGTTRARDSGSWIELQLPDPGAFGLESVVAFFAARVIPGLEHCEGARLRRVLRVGDGFAGVEIDVADPASPRLRLHPSAFAQVRTLVDTVVGALGLLAPCHAMPDFAGHRPVRVPGAFDPFEVAVRAILGQQVSVRAATTLAGRLVERAGPRIELPGFDDLDRAFPSAADVLATDLASLGVPARRAAALRALATAVHDGSLGLTPGADPQAARNVLAQLPGLGPWTIEYIAMRALGDPDAFPYSDLVLRKVLAAPGEPPLSAREVATRAEAWRPWRAHACLAIWGAASATAPTHDSR